MSRTADQILSEEFLQVRAKLLEIAAFYDRLQRAEPHPGGDRQLELLSNGCRILTDAEGDKAARVQLLFSRQYDQQWRTTMDV